MIPAVFSRIPKLLADQQRWQSRYVAMMALSLFAEGADEDFERYFKKVIEWTLPLFKDPHPRVRWAATNVFGELADDFNPTFQEKHHKLALPALIFCFDDFKNQRVQAHALASTINMLDNLRPDITKLYLEPILKGVVKIIDNGRLDLKVKAVNTLAALMNASKKEFLPVRLLVKFVSLQWYCFLLRICGSRFERVCCWNRPRSLPTPKFLRRFPMYICVESANFKRKYQPRVLFGF